MIKELVIENDKRLFIIGDLHGCFDLYKNWCDKYNVTYEDVVISVGDVIDRGKNSKECLDEFLIKQNRFMVLGNHEERMVNAVHDSQLWMYNGGSETILSIGEDNYEYYTNLLKKLPVYLRIQYGDLKLGVAHAEIPNFIYTENMLKDNINKLKQNMIWGRSVIKSDIQSIKTVEFEDYTIHGHTVVDSPIRIKNRIYIDTGAVFYDKLSFVQFDKNEMLIETFYNG